MASRLPDRPEPAGFGNCPDCAYAGTGTPAICFECALGTIEEIAVDESCQICDGHLEDDESCKNPLCNRSVEQRGWERNYAISMRSGVLEKVISLYKYDEVKGWAWIFGRVLVGYIEAVFQPGEWDILIPMPTYVASDGERSWDHIDLIVERAEIEGSPIPIRRDVMRKTRATARLVAQDGFYTRALVAEQEIGPALEVVDAAAVAGKNVLVFDDVFTGGLTLREAARKLVDAGTSRVGGVVLARQPFRS
jgi:predicted amidophosphoribosyltransferase